jgi:predicted signal transduction protein with EAL and GGDEF domain
MLTQGTARVGASVGIAFYCRHGQSLEALLKAAEGAMYRARSAGKGRIAVAG